jgi:DNA end-binding protein Ku
MFTTTSTPLAGADAPRGRPSWSGLLRLSLVSVPVKAYPAHAADSTIRFHQLHANCGRRIQHQKRCPVHGAVDAAEIIPGFEYAPDHYVRIDAEERQKTRPTKDRALVLEQFIPNYQVDPLLYAGRGLYVLPDGVAARHPYALLTQALQEANTCALGHVVLSVKRQLVLIRPLGRLLVMDVLRYPRDVRGAGTLGAELRASAATAEEARLLRTLIDAASGPVDWSTYRDVHAEEMRAVIDTKIEAQPLTAPTGESAGVLQLLDALKQSVAIAQGDSSTGKSKLRTSRRRTRQ